MNVSYDPLVQLARRSLESADGASCSGLRPFMNWIADRSLSP
jgi:hypothetical protein